MLLSETNNFSISLHDMPDIDPTVAFHPLNIDPNAHYVSQWQKRQTFEKVEATMREVKGLLDATFIS